MKKILIIMAALLLMMPMATVASFNLADMTDDELLSLNRAIIEEAINREKTALIPVGWYVVGEDIPAGTYFFEGAGKESYHNSVVGLFESLDAYKRNPEVPSYKINISPGYPSAEQKIVLESGNVFSIDKNGVFAKKFHTAIDFK